MEKQKIKDLFKFLPKAKHKAGEGLDVGEYPFYTSSAIVNKFFDEYDYEPNKLIFATGGSASVHFANSKFAVSTDNFILEPNKDVNAKYVYYYLNNNIKVLQDGFHGAGLQHLSKDYLSEIKIPIFDCDVQNKIVSMLDKADEIRRNKKLANDKLDEFLKSTFISMFGDPVKNEKGFNCKPFIEICLNIFGGGTPSKSHSEYYIGDIPWVTPKDMKTLIIEDSIDHINENAINNSSAKLIPVNSILMVIRSGILKHTLPVAINKVNVAVNQDMKAFILNDKVANQYYILYQIRLIEKSILKNVRSVTADNIEFNLIKNLELVIPPIEEQNKFAQIVEKVEIQKQKNEKAIEQMNNLFNSLSQRAFKGEL